MSKATTLNKSNVQESIPEQGWTTQQSAERYGVNDWGARYFAVGEDGHVQVIDPENPDGLRVSLLTIMEGLR